MESLLEKDLFWAQLIPLRLNKYYYLYYIIQTHLCCGIFVPSPCWQTAVNSDLLWQTHLTEPQMGQVFTKNMFSKRLQFFYDE